MANFIELRAFEDNKISIYATAFEGFDKFWASVFIIIYITASYEMSVGGCFEIWINGCWTATIDIYKASKI